MCVHSHNFCNFIFSILRYTFWCPIVCPLMLTPCQTKNVCELQAYSTYPPHTRWTSDVLECRGTSCKLGSHSLCNISVFLKIRESLMQQGFPPMVTRATYPDSPFIGQLHWQTFLVRSCKVPPMEPCFPEGAPIEEICRLEVCAVGGTREGGFWKFRSQSSSRLSHISKLWQLWMHNKMKDQVTFLVTNPGLWLLTSLKFLIFVCEWRHSPKTHNPCESRHSPKTRNPSVRCFKTFESPTSQKHAHTWDYFLNVLHSLCVTVYNLTNVSSFSRLLAKRIRNIIHLLSTIVWIFNDSSSPKFIKTLWK